MRVNNTYLLLPPSFFLSPSLFRGHVRGTARPELLGQIADQLSRIRLDSPGSGPHRPVSRVR